MKPLQRLRHRLADTSLAPPRPVIDFGMTDAQLRTVQDKFNLQPHRLRTASVLIPIQLWQDSARIVLTQRAEHLRHHAGQISFPGGSQEAADADLAQTALRESQEEIGLNPQQVEIIGYLPDYPTLSGFRVTPVIGLVAEAAEIEADGQEVVAVHYLPLNAFLEHGLQIENKTIAQEGMRLPFVEITHDGLRIWGATAGMLMALRRLLQEEELSVEAAAAFQH